MDGRAPLHAVAVVDRGAAEHPQVGQRRLDERRRPTAIVNEDHTNDLGQVPMLSPADPPANQCPARAVAMGANCLNFVALPRQDNGGAPGARADLRMRLPGWTSSWSSIAATSQGADGQD
jgi:hypothetical protein